MIHVQPFGTVLTSILIFLTIERSFKWQSSIEERMATICGPGKKSKSVSHECIRCNIGVEVERKRIIEGYKSEAQRAQRQDEINIRIKEQQFILAKSKKDYDTFTKDVPLSSLLYVAN